MVTIPAWLRKAFHYLRKFYAASFVVWLVWIFVIDDNNVFVVWENWQKMLELERDKSYFIEQVKLVRKELAEGPKSDALSEKWAREKYMMRKPSEDVYVIVDENGQYIEEK